MKCFESNVKHTFRPVIGSPMVMYTAANAAIVCVHLNKTHVNIFQIQFHFNGDSADVISDC